MATHLHRYWNPTLQRVYNTAAPTPLGGDYTERRIITPCAWRGHAHTVLRTPPQPANRHMKADALQSLTVPNNTPLLPQRPYFAEFKSTKRKRNAVVKRKSSLSDGQFFRSAKIRLRPTDEQRAVLKTWFNAARTYYNKTIETMQHMRDNGETSTYSELRTRVAGIVRAEHPWVERVPSQVRAHATAAAQEALDANLERHAKDPRHRFSLRFQSRRRIDITPTEVITFDPLGDASNGTLKEFLPAHADQTHLRTGTSPHRRMDFVCVFGARSGLGNVPAVDSAPLVQYLLAQRKPEHSPSIVWDKRLRRFYLILKFIVERPPDTRPPVERDIVAFDPGARKFNAFYRPDGTHGELLCGASEYVERSARRCAELRSATDRAKNSKQKRKLRDRLLRAHARLRNWTRNAHYECIRKAFTLGDFMVLPVFETERMSRRANRVFGNATARKLYTWSHYSFSQRMWSKVQTTANKQMAFTREPGTSKTCDCCGTFHGSLGDAKTFVCRGCGYAVDRDYHGARGNLLAALGAALGVAWDGIDR